MKINRDKSIEEWALNEVKLNWGKEARKGIHLTDLLYPRKAFWQRIMPKYPTQDELLYWMTGNAFEKKFLDAIGYQKGETKEWNGIYYSIDLFFNFPAEIKSRRMWLAKEGKEEEVYETYLQQLRGYCAIKNKNQGWLIIVSLAEKQDDFSTKPELAIYRVEFEDAELELTRKFLLKQKDLLEHALKSKNITPLPKCPSWMCYKVRREMQTAPYCATCNRKFKTDWGLEKHKQANPTHMVVYAEYKEIIVPKCKWYEECIERR